MTCKNWEIYYHHFEISRKYSTAPKLFDPTSYCLIGAKGYCQFCLVFRYSFSNKISKMKSENSVFEFFSLYCYSFLKIILWVEINILGELYFDFLFFIYPYKDNLTYWCEHTGNLYGRISRERKTILRPKISRIFFYIFSINLQSHI